MTLHKLIWKELWQRPTAMITCLVAVVLGVTALVAIRSITVFSEQAVGQKLAALGANVLLLPKDVSLDDYYSADTRGATLKEEDAVQLAIANLPGVEHIAPKLSIPADVNGRQLTLCGILPQSTFDAQAAWQGIQAFSEQCASGCAKPAALEGNSLPPAESLAKQRFVQDFDVDEVIVGADAAKLLDVTTGDRLKVFQTPFKVIGVMPTTGTVDDSRVFAHLHTVQSLTKAGETVNVIEIMACCENAAGDLIGQLRDMFPQSKVVTISQVVDTQVSVNTLMTRVSFLFFAILLTVGIASIAGTMFANVNERRREIGTLMALGARPRLIARLFIGKALIVGIAGGFVGYVIGTAAAMGLGPYWAGIGVRPIVSLAAISVLLAAVVALVASYFPARRASLIDPCLCFQEA